MISAGRSKKKRVQLWEKSAFHFSLCFAVGFFTGFTPSNTPSFSSTHLVSYQETLKISPHLIEIPNLETEQLPPPPPPLDSSGEPATNSSGRLLIVVITTTRSGDRLQEAMLGRLARALRLAPPPLLWIVVEARSAAPQTAGLLRRTGISYRHLTFRENFTDPEVEVHHQRNVALGHIEHHRIDGIVHFAGVSNVYDLRFFEEIRGIEVFGVWPLAVVSPNKKPEITLEGPVCNASKIVGWHAENMDGSTTVHGWTTNDSGMRAPAVNIWGFAFNSSVLWDPERWGRPTSFPDASQDSMRFVHEVILEDETKVKAVPSDCSQIMLWHLQMPGALSFDPNQVRRQTGENKR